MTPEEFGVIALGYQRREDREWYRAAWMVSHILAAFAKKPPTPDKLLGPEFRRRQRRRRMTTGATEQS